MPYGADFEKAAMRNMDAGLKLKADGKLAVAGYLFGIAGECALKAWMRKLGVRPTEGTGPDPYYSHFPAILRELRDNIEGRTQAPLRKYAESTSLFQNWHVSMRYAPTGAIQPTWVEAWKSDMEQLIGEMQCG